MFGIHPSQGCFASFLHAEMVELLSLRLQVVGDVPEAFSARQLPDQQGEELTPAVI